MARTLSSNEIHNRNIWLKLVFFAAVRGLIDRTIVNHKDYNELEAAAKEVYEVIVNAKFKDIDHEINILADAKLHFQNPDPVTSSSELEVTPILVAEFLASLCAEKQIYWEDIRHTSYTFVEIKAFKDTIFGKALLDFECYVSNDPAFSQQPAQPAPQVNQRAPSNRQPGQAPSINYKQSGAHSQDASNLIGQPNQKIMLSGSMYDIEADMINRNTPHAFVTPIYAVPPYTKQQHKAMEVKFSSANGYTDMACWFDDIDAANNFLQKCQAKFGAKYPTMHIARSKADQNGYFRLSTEFGDCLVRAKWFNEQLQEDAEFEAALNAEKDRISKMNKDEYHAYMKEFCENHRNILD